MSGSTLNYVSPLTQRYASREMSHLFSPHFKYTTWRKLWIALAKAQKSLGLAITDAQIRAMQTAQDTLDLDKVKAYEETLHHDVMAHIHAFADLCPEARSILHLGATSCYVTDNTDLIQMRDGLSLLHHKIRQALRNLHAFAKRHATLACLSYTHFQPAQPTTVGKRACLWLQDLLLDFREIEHRLHHLQFLGVKGATGTQASFLALFHGDESKVKQLDQAVAKEMGFTRLFPVTGQTYTRKQDIQILSTLSSFAASCHKFGNDIRLLSHLCEIEEPFLETQVGSSAMPHKRNPVRSERICALARFLISLSENPLYTEATQWLERTLDDSANRRLSIPEAFLTADALLDLVCHVTAGLTVHPKIIRKHLDEELPFLATEPILMAAVQKGKDRQEIHEKLRAHSLATSRAMKEENAPNDLIERIVRDKEIGLSKEEIGALLHADRFTGCAVAQTEEFLRQEVEPLL